jgi:hypothetical protein
MYLIQECRKQLLSHPAHLTQNQNSPVNFTNTSLLHQLNEGPSTNGLLMLPLLQAASFLQMHKNSHFLFIQKQVAWRKFTYQNLIGDSKACTSYTTGATTHQEEKTGSVKIHMNNPILSLHRQREAPQVQTQITTCINPITRQHASLCNSKVQERIYLFILKRIILVPIQLCIFSYMNKKPEQGLYYDLKRPYVQLMTASSFAFLWKSSRRPLCAANIVAAT